MFTRKELLEILGFSETDNPSNEALANQFDKLKEKMSSLQDSVEIENAYINLVKQNELLQKTPKPPKLPSNSIFFALKPNINFHQKDDFPANFNQQLRDNLNRLFPNGEYIVGGSPQATMGIMCRNNLLMRCRLGNLFRGGGASIELIMKNIEKMHPDELAKTAMTIIETCIKNPQEVLLGFHDISHKILESLQSLVKNQDFYVQEVQATGEVTSGKQFSPNPFKLSPIPFQ